MMPPHKLHSRATGTNCPWNSVPPLSGRVKPLPQGHLGFELFFFFFVLLTSSTPAGPLQSTRQERGSKDGDGNNSTVHGKKPPKKVISLLPYGLCSGNAQPPKLSRLWGHHRKFSLSQLCSTLGQTSAHQSWPHPGAAAPQPVGFIPALSQEKQKEPPGEDPILQPTL